MAAFGYEKGSPHENRPPTPHHDHHIHVPETVAEDEALDEPLDSSDSPPRQESEQKMGFMKSVSRTFADPIFGSADELREAKERLLHGRMEAIQQRSHNPQYHMGSYGTFGMDTVHGRLFELGVDIDSLKMHTLFYFAFVLVSLAIWPIAFLVAIPVGYLAGKDRDLQMFKVLLTLASIIGYFITLFPSLVICFGGGFAHFYKLIFEKKELNLLDFIDFLLSELMIMLLIVFALVFHTVALDVESYKGSIKESWRHRHREYGISVTFPDFQMKRLTTVLEDILLKDDKKDAIVEGNLPSYRSSGSTASRQRAAEDNAVHIEDIIRILEVLPGWTTYGLGFGVNVNDYHAHVRGVETGLFSELVALENDAMAKNLWPIDVWLVKTQWYPDEELSLTEGLKVSFYSTTDLLAMVWKYVTLHPIALVVLTLLSMVRTALPRLWLWYNGGEIFPNDGASELVVGFSALVSFTAIFFWLATFFFILMEYRRNLCQVVIMTGLVDAPTRVRYSQYFLMSIFWFRTGPEECEDVLSKYPLLDLRVSSNAAAFWRLREYTALDRSNERMGISILLEVVVIWLLLKFLATIATVYFSTSDLPAVVIVTVFDLVVFGGMLLVSLSIAIQINTVVKSHSQVFVQAKYECTMAMGYISKQLTDMAAGEQIFVSPRAGLTDTNVSKEALEKKREDLELSRKLLNEYLDICVEGEHRDHILFGFHVTPTKILSFAATFIGMIYTLLHTMVKHEHIQVSDEVEDQLKTPALHAIDFAVRSFLHLNRTSKLF